MLPALVELSNTCKTNRCSGTIFSRRVDSFEEMLRVLELTAVFFAAFAVMNA